MNIRRARPSWARYIKTAFGTVLSVTPIGDCIGQSHFCNFTPNLIGWLVIYAWIRWRRCTCWRRFFIGGRRIERFYSSRGRKEGPRRSFKGKSWWDCWECRPHSKHQKRRTVQASRNKTAPIAMRLPWNAYAQPADLPYSQNPSDQLSLNCPSQNNSQKRVRVMSQLQSCARLPRVRRSFQSIRASSGRYSRDWKLFFRSVEHFPCLFNLRALVEFCNQILRVTRWF